MKQHFQSYWLLYLLLLAGLAYLVYRWYTNKDVPKVQGGSGPTATTEDCRTGGGGARLTEQCTRPKYNVAGGVKQKCWTSEELGDLEFGPETIVEQYGVGKKWYYNFQSGNKFCYVDSPKYIF